MEKVLERIRRETEGQYRHAFVLTQNVRDLVWLGTGERYLFPSALCRSLTRPTADGRHRLVAKYSISQGIMVYYDGEVLDDLSHPVLNEFGRITGLQEMLVVRNRSAADMQTQAHSHPEHILPSLYPFLRRAGSVNSLVVDRAEYVIDSGIRGHGASYPDRVMLELLQNWAVDTAIHGAGGSVIMLCAEVGSVPPDLTRGDSGFLIIPVSYPNLDERRQFLAGRGALDEQSRRLANLTTGFRRADLDEVWRRNMSDADIAERKAELIVARCGDVLELVSAPDGLEMANAQPHVKQYLIRLREQMSRDPKSAVVPMGILFVGVPGNGKSHLARAFAHDCGMNMLRFKNLRSMWVGESERNLETVLDLLPSLAPSVVFIDEVDQMFAARSVGAGHYGDQVEARLLGRLLEFMGNPSHRGDILWIGATNRPDLMDVATLRRFDRVFAFMNPSDAARAALVGDLLSRLGVPHSADFDCAGAAQLMADFSCDEVEKVIRRAYELCVADEEAAVTNRHVDRARASFKHNYDPMMHELVALLSVQGSNFVSDLPWYDNEGKLTAREHLPPFLLGLVDDDGALDLRRIGQRAEELRAIMRSR